MFSGAWPLAINAIPRRKNHDNRRRCNHRAALAMDISKTFEMLKTRRALHDVDVNRMTDRQNSALRAHLFKNSFLRTSLAVRIRELTRKQRSPQSVSKLFCRTGIVHLVNRHFPTPLRNQQGRDNNFPAIVSQGKGFVKATGEVR